MRCRSSPDCSQQEEEDRLAVAAQLGESYRCDALSQPRCGGGATSHQSDGPVHKYTPQPIVWGWGKVVMVSAGHNWSETSGTRAAETNWSISALDRRRCQSYFKDKESKHFHTGKRLTAGRSAGSLLPPAGYTQLQDQLLTEGQQDSRENYS